MSKKLNRFLSLMLAIVMILGMMPAAVLAAEVENASTTQGNPAEGMVAKVGDTYYATLTEAMGKFNGRTVEVLCDVEESISGFYGVNLITNVDGGVTITDTNIEDWIDFDDVTVGAGVTLNIGNPYSGDSENVILGTLNVGDTYYHGYDAKTTIKDGGKVTVGGTTILRYNKNAGAGIYIYGDGNDETVEFDCDYYIGAYSGAFYAENANVECGYFLLKNSYDNSSYADIAMTLDNSSVTVVGTTDTQDSFIIDDQAFLTLKNGSAIADVRDFQILAGANLALSVDETSTISATNVSVAEDVALDFEKNQDGTVSFKKVLKGDGTASDPILINDLEDLILFRDAVDTQASDGSTQFAGKYIKLMADIDLSGINWNPIGSMSGDHGSFKGVFDGNGHTISNLNCQQSGNGLGLFARTAGNAVIKNLTLHNVTVKSTNNSNYVGGLVGNSYASTKIEDVHVTGTIDISGRGYIGGISGHGYVVMDNVSVVGEGTISSTFWCAGGILGYGGEGATHISNASVEGTGNGLTITSAAGGLGAIIGMAEDNNGTQPISGENLSAKNVVIKTYTGAYGDAYANYALGYLYGGNPTSELTGDLVVENVEIITSNNTEPEVNDAVASIGDVLYFDLQAAINAVAEGQTITLLRDVNVTTAAYGQNALNHARAVSFTLDLNGKTLSANTGNSVLRFNIDGAGATADVTVTVKNGKIVAGADTWCAVMASAPSADAKAILNLEDLTVESGKAGDLAVKAWSNSVINAKNVTVNATNGAGGFYALGGEIVLDNCTVVQKGLHTAPYLSMALAVSSGGKMTVNSGTYSAEPTAAAEGNNQGTSHGSWVGGVMNSGGTLIINGGTFSNGNFGEDNLATAARGLLFVDTAGKIEVNGGTFNALKNIFDVQNNLGDASKQPDALVSGGTFSADPTVAGANSGFVRIANGYVVKQNADGTYGLKAANEAWILRNGMPVFYATLADAIADAQAGETVMLCANATVDTRITIDKNITLSDYGTLTVSLLGNAGFDIKNGAEVTFDNFNIDISGAVIPGDAIITVGNDSTAATLNLSGMNITGDGYNSAYAVIYLYATGNLNMEGGSIDVSNDKSGAGGVIKANGSAVPQVNISNATLSFTDAGIGFLDGTVVLDKVELTINGGGNAINSSALTVIDSTVTIDGADGRALTLSQGNVTIVNSDLVFSNCSEGGIRFKKGLTLRIDADSTIADCTVYADASAVDTANVNGNAVTGSEANKSSIVDGALINPEWAAKIGSVYYMTVAEAITAAAAGDTVTVLAGEYTCDVSVNKAITVVGEGQVIINGKLSITADGAAVKNLTVKNPSGNAGYISAKNVLIEGCDISGSNAFRYCYTSGTVTFKDSKISADTWAIHFDGSAGGNIVVDNCDVSGWCAFAGSVDTITLQNSDFQQGGWAGMRTYNKTLVINGCTFNNGYKVDIAATGATVTVNNTVVTDGEVKSLFHDADIDACTITVDSKKLITVDATIGEAEYDTLAEAIAAAGEGDVVIELQRDVALDYNAREAFGIADTTSLTINGNGYTLTLNQKDSDWSSIGLANTEAKLVLNNMTIEKTGYGDTSGAWNTHAINFTCEVEMNDVIVNNAISVEDGAVLNYVTINEANGYYGLWIDGNGQTVNITGGQINATNGGRGIKIGDEYVDVPASVTLNVNGMKFNTAKKAAVLVSSSAGADITAYNEDITNVAADTVNFVWVDEDWAVYFGNVTATDCTVAQESAADFAATVSIGGIVQAYYKTLAEALGAARSGDTVQLTVDCELGYVMFTPGATLDLNGFKLTCSGLAAFKGSHVIDTSADTTGLLIVPRENLSLQADNKELPIWNEENGYVFVTPNTSVASNYQYFEAVTDNSFKLAFRPGFGHVDGKPVRSTYLATNGGTDNGLTMILRLTWDNSSGHTVHHDVAFDDDFFYNAYQSGQAFKVTVTGTAVIGEVTVNAVIVSDTGVEFVGEDMVYTPDMAGNAE